MAITTATVLRADGSTRSMVETWIDKNPLKRRPWKSVFASSEFGMRKPIPHMEGQSIKFTTKSRMRRPEKMASPGAGGSDPASGAQVTAPQIIVPIEWIHEYSEVATTLSMTSWINCKEWVKEDLPVALDRRKHELTQNAFLSGRMNEGLYDSSGDLTTSFDTTAEATVTLYGESFTFQKCPRYYGNGKGSFAAMDSTDTLTWSDLTNAAIRLSNSGAPKINGKYVCVCSDAQMNDLLRSGDAMFRAAIQGGSAKLLKSLEEWYIGSYMGWHFVRDDQPFTMTPSSEVVRANWGEIHAAICFGAGCFGYTPLGSRGMGKPKMKVQDTTKTGYSFTIGYLEPWQVAIVNPNWGCSIISYVSENLPNNYDVTDPNAQLDGFAIL